ncbi:MAG: hypothetical protein ABFQ95_03455 [Pseudomonadota bacterium]
MYITFPLTRILAATFLIVGFLTSQSSLLASVTSGIDSDNEVLIRLHQQPNKYSLEVLRTEGDNQVCLLQKDISRSVNCSPFSLSEALQCSTGLKHLTVDLEGALTLCGATQKDTNIAIRIETFGSVILNDLFARRLDMLAKSVVSCGQTTILSTHEFRVDEFKLKQGTLALGRGRYHVNGTFSSGVKSKLKALGGMHLVFKDFNNQGEVEAENLLIKLQTGVTKLGRIQVAKTLKFAVTNQVNFEYLIESSDLSYKGPLFVHNRSDSDQSHTYRSYPDFRTFYKEFLENHPCSILELNGDCLLGVLEYLPVPDISALCMSAKFYRNWLQNPTFLKYLTFSARVGGYFFEKARRFIGDELLYKILDPTSDPDTSGPDTDFFCLDDFAFNKKKHRRVTLPSMQLTCNDPRYKKMFQFLSISAHCRHIDAARILGAIYRNSNIHTKPILLPAVPPALLRRINLEFPRGEMDYGSPNIKKIFDLVQQSLIDVDALETLCVDLDLQQYPIIRSFYEYCKQIASESSNSKIPLPEGEEFINEKIIAELAVRYDKGMATDFQQECYASTLVEAKNAQERQLGYEILKDLFEKTRDPEVLQDLAYPESDEPLALAIVEDNKKYLRRAAYLGEAEIQNSISGPLESASGWWAGNANKLDKMEGRYWQHRALTSVLTQSNSLENFFLKPENYETAYPIMSGLASCYCHWMGDSDSNFHTFGLNNKGMAISFLQLAETTKHLSLLTSFAKTLTHNPTAFVADEWGTNASIDQKTAQQLWQQNNFIGQKTAKLLWQQVESLEEQLISLETIKSYAAFHRCQRYFNGDGVPQSNAIAYDWYNVSLQTVDRCSIYWQLGFPYLPYARESGLHLQMAEFYKIGVEGYFEPDLNKAAECLIKIVKSGENLHVLATYDVNGRDDFAKLKELAAMGSQKAQAYLDSM